MPEGSPTTVKAPTPDSTELQRPQAVIWAVAREDGTMTPLNAVDELPSTVQIAGVPAILSPTGTIDMVSFGLKERSSQCYQKLCTTTLVMRTPTLLDVPINGHYFARAGKKINLHVCLISDHYLSCLATVSIPSVDWTP